MKHIIILLLCIFSFGYADSVLLVKKGWQLIGATSKIKDMQIFDPKYVEQVWYYDASTQKWQGYSPDTNIATKIKEKGYTPITELQRWNGFWVKSKKEWAFTFPTDTITSDDHILLKKGWNLISLPVNTVVSPHIFDGKTVWKYANGRKWELFDKENSENFPTITHITNSDGIWVKSNKDQTISTVTESAKLHNFKTMDDVKSYIKDMLQTHNRPYCGYYPMLGIARQGGGDLVYTVGVASAGNTNQENKGAQPQAASNTSGTNIQEEGVDEADIIKHDKTTIFYLHSNPKNDMQNEISVTTFDNIANNHLKPITTIVTEGSAIDMYLANNYLVVISRNGSSNYKPLEPTPQEAKVLSGGGDIASMLVEIFDVSDISHIKRTNRYKINGTINSSRMINGKLYLITEFHPYINVTYPHIYVDAPECKDYFFGNRVMDVPVTSAEGTTEAVPSINGGNSGNKTSTSHYEEKKKYAKCYTLQVDEKNRFYRVDYDNPNITYERLIPFIQKNSEGEVYLLSPKTFYAPDKKDQEPTITTVSKFDIQTGDLEQTSSILGYTNTIYASQNALYLVSNKYPFFYNFDRYKEQSVIYKFRLDNDLTYSASGFVNGRILNQFSLSEYQDILRVATTQGNSWQNNTTNALYTLATFDQKLLIQGTLSGLGKDGETIQSVRFMGKRGYIVTFKQTDPFYTLDLSNPQNPLKIGELKIDGFSSYLHPINQNLILGFGRDATPDGQVLGLKLELFDVTDFAHPNAVDSYTLPGNYAWSEVEHNHKALAFRKSDNLMAFSYTIHPSYARIEENRLGVFQIINDKIQAYNPLKSSAQTGFNRYPALQRGLIFDKNGQTYVAYFSNGTISYKTLTDLGKE